MRMRKPVGLYGRESLIPGLELRKRAVGGRVVITSHATTRPTGEQTHFIPLGTAFAAKCRLKDSKGQKERRTFGVMHELPLCRTDE